MWYGILLLWYKRRNFEKKVQYLNNDALHYLTFSNLDIFQLWEGLTGRWKIKMDWHLISSLFLWCVNIKWRVSNLPCDFNQKKLLCETTDIWFLRKLYFQTPSLQAFHHHISVCIIPLTMQYTKRTKCQPSMEMNSPPFSIQQSDLP